MQAFGTWLRSGHRAMVPLIPFVINVALLAGPPGFRLGTELGYEHGLAGAPSHAILGSSQSVDLADGAVELAGGFRLAVGAMHPSPRGAAFVRSSVCARQDGYRPAIGLELELTAVPRSVPTSDEPEGSLTRAFAKARRDDVVRGAVVMAPARFQWEHVFVSVGTVRIVAPLRGTGLRFQMAFGFLELGWRL
jgi:hypothetical protein